VISTGKTILSSGLDMAFACVDLDWKNYVMQMNDSCAPRSRLLVGDAGKRRVLGWEPQRVV
jgi:hypothetical protein